MGMNTKTGKGRAEPPSGASPEQRHRALEESSKAWDSRIKSTIKQARKAARRSAA